MKDEGMKDEAERTGKAGVPGHAFDTRSVGTRKQNLSSQQPWFAARLTATRRDRGRGGSFGLRDSREDSGTRQGSFDVGEKERKI
jgi:hypothetical protein